MEPEEKWHPWDLLRYEISKRAASIGYPSAFIMTLLLKVYSLISSDH